MNNIKPAFNKDEVAVIFAVSDNYVPIFSVCLQSLISNSSSKNNYDLFVLTENITYDNQKRLSNMCPNNFSLRFIDVKPFLDKYNKDDFYLSEHITIAAYYRFFIPKLFSLFDKVIYSDSDLVFTDDVAELYKIDLQGHIIGAALSGWPFAMNDSFKSYCIEKLKMADPYLYIQDGVLLCNVSKMKETNFTEECIERLKEIKTPRTWDQCVINSLCYGDIHFLDRKWNLEWHYPFYHPQYDKKVLRGLYDEYIEARKTAKIIHYASATKPWNEPKLDLAFHWWKYAKKSPFYKEILSSNTKVGDVEISILLQKIAIINALKNIYYRVRDKVSFYNKIGNIISKFIWKKVKNTNNVYIKFMGIKVYKRKKIKNNMCTYLLGLPIIKKNLYKSKILGIPFYRNQKSQIDSLTKKLKNVTDSFNEFKEDAFNYIEELKYESKERKNSLAKIFCTYHYQDGCPIFKSDVYEPIQTGAINADYDFGVLRDDTGDNISDKNNFYAELTATYWVWKNWLKQHPEVEYIGADHHYSHLDWTRIHPLQRQGCSIYKVPLPQFMEEFETYNSKYINFEPYDIILPKKIKYGQINQTLLTQYIQHHPLEQYELFEKIVAEFHPESKPLLPKLRNLQDFYLGNSYAMRRYLFEDYCQWLFPMLFELEKRSEGFEKYKNYPAKRRRMPPFLSERFINLWLMEKQQSSHPLKIGERTWTIIPL